MFNIERWQEIFEAISKNKLRTALTCISVMSGIFILIILLGIGNGMQNGVKKQFENDAASIVSVWSGPTSLEYKGLNPNRKIDLNTEDYAYLEKRFKGDVEALSGKYRKYGAFATYGKESGSYTFIGLMPDMLYLENAVLNAGRFISEKDMQQKAKVVCIGIRVAKDLFASPDKAIGEFIFVNQIPMKVIGVYTDSGGEREDANLFVPLTTMTQIYNDPNSVGSMHLTLEPEANYESSEIKVNNFLDQYLTHLRKVHKVHPDDTKAIQFFSSLTEAKKFITLNSMISIFFWSIGMLTLFAGIVGVANIMLIIVKERTKEIGIRKALGAQPKSIVAMILHEAIFITTLSGFIGLILSLTVLEFLSKNVKNDYILNPSVDFNISIIVVIILIVSGAVAGYIPARHAAKIKPIIALRDE